MRENSELVPCSRSLPRNSILELRKDMFGRVCDRGQIQDVAISRS
jgi:hypothetical protein